MSPPPVLPASPRKPHDCTRKSSVCEECAPSKIEKRPSPKGVPIRPGLSSPIGSLQPPIIPVRSLRRAGTLFQAPPIGDSPSVEANDSTTTFPRYEETTEDLRPNDEAPPEKIVEIGRDEFPATTVLLPTDKKQVNAAPKYNNIPNREIPPVPRTGGSPKRIPPGPNRESIDTIAEIISHYSPAESISPTTTTVTASEAGNQKSPRDEDIFRGLQVVTLAACDKDVDTWIKDMSGPGIRKFLADVSEFEKLGIGELSRQARRMARRRRRQLEKALKEKEAAGGGDVGQGQNDGIVERSSRSGSSTVRDWKSPETMHRKADETNRDGKMGFVAGGESVCHVSGSRIHTPRSRDRRVDEESHKECGECIHERRIEKGKGKEMEKEVGIEAQNHENSISRRDRFAFRDGCFH